MTKTPVVVRRRRPFRAWVGLVVLVAACFAQEVQLVGPGETPDPGTTPGGGQPGTLTATPASGTLAVGATLQITLVQRDSAGINVPIGVVTWTSSNQTVATVDGTGRITGRSAGLATITASTAGLAATVSLQVVPVPVASVTVAPGTATLQLGTTAQFIAVSRDAAGLLLVGRPVTWSTSNAAVLTVSSSGLVTSRGVGSATVTAAVEGQTGSSPVTVQNVPVASVQVVPGADTVHIGKQTQLVAVPRDANGIPLSGRAITWSSSAPAVARVSGSGLIDGLVAGTAVISATSEGQTGTATITVIPVPVAAVIVVPQSVTVLVGTTTTFNATPRDANGGALTGRSVTWATANSAIATVSPSGVVSGIAPGSVLISATCEGVTGSAFVTITTAPATLVQVTILPATAALLSGQTQQFTLSGQLSDGATVPVTGSFTASGGSVSGGGLYTAPDQSGTFLVIGTATGSSLRDTASVTVTRPPVATVQVNPATATLNVGSTLSLAAVLRDASGSILTNRTVTWSSNNTTAATVSNSGVVTGRAAGTATITATSEGQSGTATLTLQVTPVATVQVSPASSTIDLGTTTQLNAVTRDANGNVLTGRVVTWTSSNPLVATVSGTGLVTGVAAGSATITATSETRTATASITVIYRAVASVQVSPSTESVVIGGSYSFTAVARDANNGVLSGRPVTWTSSNAAVATVSAAGLAVGVTAGSASIRATVEGVTGSATLTVTIAPPIGSVPEMPGGYNLRVQWMGSPAPPSGWATGWAGSVQGSATVVTDAAAPVSGPDVARITYPSGFHSGDEPQTWEYTGTNGAGAVVYTYWFKYSVGFQGEQSSVNKHVFLFASDGSVIGYTAARFSGTTQNGYIDWLFEGGATGSTAFTWLANTHATVRLSDWHRVTIEVAAPAVRLWVDGVKVGETTSASLKGRGPTKIAPTWGGNTGDRMSQTGYLYLDELRVYTR